MQLLSSKNYEEVHVYLRDVPQPFVMPAVSGLKLMNYLTSDIQTKHVRLTDKASNEILVLITDIKKVQPVTQSTELNELVERLLK